jgi:hypothetical protein
MMRAALSNVTMSLSLQLYAITHCPVYGDAGMIPHSIGT